MSTLQLEWSETELLATDPVEAPLIAAGRRCHGGFDADGTYRSPRTRFRAPAIEAWQRHHREQFGTELLDVPLETWPESYPNATQARFLLSEGVREPLITILTRIGTVEGFGAMIRHAAPRELQRHFDEPIAGCALGHLGSGLFEAHARDEAGSDGEAGHQEMWYAARDVAFEHPVSQDQTEEMLRRMGLADRGDAPDRETIRRRQLAERVFEDVDLDLELLIQRMVSLLLIEIRAFHIFAWAETVLADTDLVAGDGDAARLVSYIRQDETPHVEYLRTALTEMRDRTFVGASGRRHPGVRIVGELWARGLDESLGARRQEQLHGTLGEIERSLASHPRRDDLLEEFHTLGSVRPDPSGTFVAT